MSKGITSCQSDFLICKGQTTYQPTLERSEFFTKESRNKVKGVHTQGLCNLFECCQRRDSAAIHNRAKVYFRYPSLLCQPFLLFVHFFQSLSYQGSQRRLVGKVCCSRHNFTPLKFLAVSDIIRYLLLL